MIFLVCSVTHLILYMPALKIKIEKKAAAEKKILQKGCRTVVLSCVNLTAVGDMQTHNLDN
jgi:hypothetical protein